MLQSLGTRIESAAVAVAVVDVVVSAAAVVVEETDKGVFVSPAATNADCAVNQH